MKKRDLFVFSGQSNMMGACDIPPKHELTVKDSVEYKYREKYLERGEGYFSKVTYQTGEFLYCDIKKAYHENCTKSKLNEYHPNVYFMPSMASNGKDFSDYSESDYICGASIVPYFCENYEAKGKSPIVCHIAKGAVDITHYYNREMESKYNTIKPEGAREIKLDDMCYGAHEVFKNKVRSFFADAENCYDTGKKVFVWLQGESNGCDSYDEYKCKINILYDYIKDLGFDYFFCIRVGYWGEMNIINVLNAQEDFCKEHDDCHMVSRAISYMQNAETATDGWRGSPIPDEWYKKAPGDEYLYCRDTYYGKNNPHINEKGFMLVAKELADNAYRILAEGKKAKHGEELVELKIK